MESVGIALRARGLKAKLSPMVEMIVAGGTCMVLWFGARMVLDGSLSAGSLVVFVLYLGKMYKPMQELSKMTDTYSKAAVAWERIQEVLQTKRDVEDLPGAAARSAVRGQHRIRPCRLQLQSQVAGAARRELPHRAGADGGAGGSDRVGKDDHHQPDGALLRSHRRRRRRSTDTTSEVPAESLRQQISFVLQETLLFHGTIGTNIAYGKSGATMDEIVRAAEAGQCDRVHREDAGRLRHDRGRARRDALRRAAPAHRDRAGGDPQSADPDPGRADVRAGRGIGEAGLRRAGPADGGQDVVS